MIRKRQDSHRLRLLRRISIVIFFSAALAAGCKVWTGTCAEPKDLQFSGEFAQLTTISRDSPGMAAGIFFDEISRSLAWFGKSRIHNFNLTEICQIDVCTVDSISIKVEVEHLPICSWADNHFNHSIATIAINDFTTLEPEFEIEEIRASWGSDQRPWTGFAAELEWARNHAWGNITNAYWIRHNELKIIYNRYFGNWFPDSDWYVRIEAMDKTRLLSTLFFPYSESARGLRYRSR